MLGQSFPKKFYVYVQHFKVHIFLKSAEESMHMHLKYSFEGWMLILPDINLAKPGLEPKLNGSQDISGKTSVSQYEIDKAN